MDFIDAQHITAIGLVGIFLIIFAETGLLIGFFLPGDTLLFTAGFLASQGHFSIILLIMGALVAAIVGDSVGYSIGYRLGPKVFTKKDSILFDQDHVRKAQNFYDKHGGKTIVLARFIPMIRTFAPVIAGVGKMHYRNFIFYNISGGILWVVGVTLLGYWLGAKIPNIDAYILPILLLIIIGSFGSSFVHILMNKKSRYHLKRKLDRYRKKLKSKFNKLKVKLKK